MRLLTVLLAVLLLACQKKDSAPVVTEGIDCSSYNVNRTADVSQASFKTGTYWVLHDSVTNTLDSLCVTSGNSFLVEYPQVKGHDCHTRSDRYGIAIAQYTYSSVNSNPVVVPQGDFEYIAIDGKHVTLSGNEDVTQISSSCSYHPCGTVVYEDYNMLVTDSLKHKYDSAFVYNKHQKKVVKFTYPKGSLPNYTLFKNRREFYFNTESGFLRARKFDANGNLISHKVLVRYFLVK
jgi:hypothetical protein